ncbi:MAG: sugar phosphate isomerase/epimerase family protein [Anaeroplasmataceae bacterium]
MAKIGVQIMIFRNQIIKDGVYSVLEKLSKMGYRCIEVSQVEMTPANVSELKRACKDFNIEIAALSASVEPMMPGQEALTTHFDKIVQDCVDLNCKFLRVGMLPFGYIGSLEKALTFASIIEAQAVKLKEHGIRLYYHNHHIEFIKYDGKYLLDIIKDNTKEIGFELDVHWIQRGGENPVEYIKQYKGRLELLHLKDYKIISPNFEGISLADIGKFMQAFNDVVRFAEIGEGSLDFTNIIKTGIETGARFLLIEQDDTYGRDPFESLKISRDNLVKLGFENLF